MDWKTVAKTTREPVSHLQRLARWKEAVRETAPQNRARGREISTDQMLDEGRSAEEMNLGLQAHGRADLMSHLTEYNV